MVPAAAGIAEPPSTKKSTFHYFWGCSAWAPGCRWPWDHPSEEAKRLYGQQFEIVEAKMDDCGAAGSGELGVVGDGRKRGNGDE